MGQHPYSIALRFTGWGSELEGWLGVFVQGRNSHFGVSRGVGCRHCLCGGVSGMLYWAIVCCSCKSALTAQFFCGFVLFNYCCVSHLAKGQCLALLRRTRLQSVRVEELSSCTPFAVALCQSLVVQANIQLET